MRRRFPGPRLVAIAIVTAFGVTAAGAGAQPASVAGSHGSTALVAVKSAQNSVLGKILVNGSGRTLYHYALDRKNAVKCTGTCAATWPPLLVAAGVTPVAAPGVTASLLGTVERPDGKLQVTYKGLALYLFTGDRKAGDVKGQGLSGSWHAIAPTGAIVTKPVKSTGTSGTGGSSGSGSSGTGSTGGGSTGGGSTGGGGGGGMGGDCETNPQGYGCM